MNSAIHPFARAGMGRGPWKFSGTFKMPDKTLAEANPQAYNNQLKHAPDLKFGLGTCACCGMAIMNVFVVKDADGDRWGVGCDCILKLGRQFSDEDNQELVRSVKLSKRNADNQKWYEKRVAALYADKATIDAMIAAGDLDGMDKAPHPKIPGKTMRDYIDWMIEHRTFGLAIKVVCEWRDATAGGPPT